MILKLTSQNKKHTYTSILRLRH